MRKRRWASPLGPGWIFLLTWVCQAPVQAGPRPGVPVSVLIHAEDAFSRATAAKMEHLGSNCVNRQKGLVLVDSAVLAGVTKDPAQAKHLARARSLLVKGVEAYENLEPENAVKYLARATTSFEKAPDILASSRRTEYLNALTYLGASQVLDGDSELGRATFGRLLVLARATRLDKRLFPPGLVQLFEEARQEVGQAPTGSMSLFSTPKHGKVFVDGIFRGVAPCTVEGLIEGRHLVSVIKAGHLPWGRVVHVEGASEATVNSRLKPGRGAALLAKAIATSADSLPDELSQELLNMAHKSRVKRIVMGNLRQKGEGVAYDLSLFEIEGPRLIRTHSGLVNPSSRGFAKAVDSLFSFLITGRGNVIESPAVAGGEGDPEKDPPKVVLKDGHGDGFGGMGSEYGDSEYDSKGEPYYNRWYFWTGIGAGVALVLGVTLGLVLDKDSGSPGSQILLEF